MTLIQGFLEGLRPTENLTVDEWSDKYRILSSVSSAEPGRWKTSRVPHMREILQKLSPSDPCQRVVFMKSVQVGATEAGLNFLGAFMDMDACPMMYVMPTVKMGESVSKKRLGPMINDCPSLNGKVSGMNRREGSSTIMEKLYPGGALTVVGANSASTLSSNPIRVVMADEVDRYPLSADNEGSPLRLVEARTTTYSKNKKIFIASTPTTTGASVVYNEFMQTDQRYRFIPCIHCGTFQTLVFSNLKWPKGKPEEAAYQCEHCGELIEERYKSKFLQDAVWIAKDPSKSSEKVAGYAINALYSPFGWMSWEEIATRFLTDKDDSIRFRTFVNTVLGEPYEERGEAPDWERLFERREDYKIDHPNNNIEMITVGVDVQGDRLELEVCGWLRDKSTYSLSYRVLDGDPSKTEVWDKLALVVKETWMRPDGVELPMMMMAVDCGYLPEHVYTFCRKYSPTQVIPVRGRDKQRTIVSSPSSIDYSMNGRAMGKTKVWNVGVSQLKSAVYTDLKLNMNEDETYPPGYCHFPMYQAEYFKGITAEKLTMKVHKGYPKYEWEKTYKRNEPLDLRVYNRAAAHVVGIDRFTPSHWDNLVGKYRITKIGHDEPVAPKKPSAPKSDFWGGR